MGTDISRVRHDPFADFAGVVLQQGRLLLDADFNEYVAILDRRLRAEACDLTSFGPDPTQAGVAWVPRLTPDGFRVNVGPVGLTIGRGRMYVDGHQVENHGLAPLDFDPLLAAPTGSADTPYELQPYWPTPDPLPAAGTHLAYLDVWQREVTHLEDPDLVESAVGVDTSGRTQTVWQVRLLHDVDVGACAADDADLPGWLDIIGPSDGRLSTATIEVDPTDDPCELPPVGGFRGLENQTYRIEIHDGGEPGTATFKWSRDNASVTVPVAEMVSPTSLRVSTVGRDDVLRISTGDWVEILDDHREFNQSAGVMRQVVVDDAARTVSFANPLPADLQPAGADDAVARHFRVRRWDQSGTVVDADGNNVIDLDAGSSGLIPVPTAATTQVVLEDGIVVSFSLAADDGRFRPGDHWIVAARTADASVEMLDRAPPLGVHHHYARLGTVTMSGSQTDCRRLWPPLPTGGSDCGDCTVCVTPELHNSGSLTVQAAVDLVTGTGGTVCLGPGFYNLERAVTIGGARGVRIRGQGLATIVASPENAFRVDGCADVTIEAMGIIAGAQAQAGVELTNTVGAHVEDTVILALAPAEARSAAIALGGVAMITAIRNNVLVGATAVATPGEVGVFAADLSIEDNVMAGRGGVDLGGRSLYLLSCRVARNEILAAGDDAIRATGVTVPDGTLDIDANRIASGGNGIAVGSDATVRHNSISPLGDDTTGDGIVIVDGGIDTSPGRVQVLANRVNGLGGRGVALEVPVVTFMVKQNLIDDVGSGIVMAASGQAEHVAIDNNVVTRVGTGLNESATVLGIAVTNADHVDIAGNSVTQVGLDTIDASLRVGILAVGCGQVRVGANSVREIGPRGESVGVSLGVGVIGPFEHLTGAENSVTFGPENVPGEGNWSAFVAASGNEGRVGFGPRTSLMVNDRHVVFTDGWAFVAETRPGHATITDNSLEGGGRLPTCMATTAGDIVAAANQCGYGREGVGMRLRGGSVAAATNRVRGPGAMLLIETAENRFSAVGNLVSNGTHFGSAGAGLPHPWDPLNPTVP